MSAGELFSWLDRRRACGVLSLSHAMIARRFHVDAGYVTLASSSEQRLLVGQLLVERGLLKPDELERALKASRETGARLGRVLTLVGLVPEDEARALLTEKVRSLLADTLTWTDGRFVFDDGALPRARPVVQVSVNLGEALASARNAPALAALTSA